MYLFELQLGLLVDVITDLVTSESDSWRTYCLCVIFFLACDGTVGHKTG